MILVVCHDSGGAEVVSSWVGQNPEPRYRFALEGPALNIFQRKLGGIHNESRVGLKESVLGSDWVLTGTSWSSDLEKKAIMLARDCGRRVASFIDHWANYLERFRYQADTILPNEIWVGDEYALQIAEGIFPKNLLRYIPNPYFQDIQGELISLPKLSQKADTKNILYICEPIEEHSIKQYGHAFHWGYTEFDAMRFFLERLQKLVSLEQKTTVRIRNHPSERKDKYHSILRQYPHLCFEQSVESSLIEDCAWADWVVGCESMALVIGLLAKKKVYSCIPPGGKPCSLPHSEIEALPSN